MHGRDILCVFEASGGELSPAAKQALAMAIAHKAHLSAYSIARELFIPGFSLVRAMTQAAIDTANAQAHSVAKAGAELVHEAAKLAGVNHDALVHQGTLPQISAWLARRARTADLTVVDRPADLSDVRQAYFEDALFSAGRPVLIASPEHISERIERVAIAWDGSRVAARALGDALSVFPQLTYAEVIVIAGEKDLEKGVPGVEAAQHLSRCDVDAHVVNVSVAHGSVARTLNDTARARKLDAIVMGGFGHSRLREFMLGGVTRELSSTASLPLLLSH